MPRLRKTTLLRRSALKAFRNPLNLAVGTAALAASFLPDAVATQGMGMQGMTPLAVWGVGAFGWVVFATVGQRYRPWVEEQERRRREAREEREREALRYKTELLLNEPPFDLWTGAGYLPPYMAIFRALKETRHRIAKVLAGRDDLDAFTKEDILQQLGYMLNAYLGFVRERVSYLQILGGTRPGEPPGPGWRKDFRRFSAKVAPVFVPAIPSLEKRLAEVDARIRQIRDLATREPATARTRQSHVGILEKHRELLLDCHKRDQCVVAQLGTFSDAFEVIHGRLSASQFSAAEVSTYMSHLVEQIVETERFVETLRPSMDGVYGMDPGFTVPMPTAVRQGGRG
ncbi:MAG: hypothetical protein ACJ75H_22780 [Thermoanaerobaculia bacterium]